LGDFLRAQPRDQTVLVAGAATQLCVGYYVNGPDWLCCSPPNPRQIIDVGHDAAGLSTVWPTGTAVAWLVTPQGTVLRAQNLGADAGILFPTADQGMTIRRLVIETQLSNR
jgi:hypothetical protein